MASIVLISTIVYNKNIVNIYATTHGLKTVEHHGIHCNPTNVPLAITLIRNTPFHEKSNIVIELKYIEQVGIPITDVDDISFY